MNGKNFLSGIFLASLLSILALTGCSKPGDATVSKAMTAYSAKNYDQALELFKQALEEETRYSPELIYGFISNVYAMNEDWENAAEYQKKSLDLHPDYRGYVTLGMLERTQGKNDKAKEAYEKAIALNPQKGEAYASLGALFLVQGNAEEARPILEKARSLEPKIAVIHGNLAICYAMLNQEKEARASLAEAETLKCENIGEFVSRVEAILGD